MRSERIGSVNVCKEALGYPLFDRNRQNEFGQSALNVTDTYDKSKEVCKLLNEAGVRYGELVELIIQSKTVMFLMLLARENPLVRV